MSWGVNNWLYYLLQHYSTTTCLRMRMRNLTPSTAHSKRYALPGWRKKCRWQRTATTQCYRTVLLRSLTLWHTPTPSESSLLDTLSTASLHLWMPCKIIAFNPFVHPSLYHLHQFNFSGKYFVDTSWAVVLLLSCRMISNLQQCCCCHVEWYPTCSSVVVVM